MQTGEPVQGQWCSQGHVLTMCPSWQPCSLGHSALLLAFLCWQAARWASASQTSHRMPVRFHVRRYGLDAVGWWAAGLSWSGSRAHVHSWCQALPLSSAQTRSALWLQSPHQGLCTEQSRVRRSSSSEAIGLASLDPLYYEKYCRHNICTSGLHRHLVGTDSEVQDN